jgi:hypothetical protein
MLKPITARMWHTAFVNTCEWRINIDIGAVLDMVPMNKRIKLCDQMVACGHLYIPVNGEWLVLGGIILIQV